MSKYSDIAGILKKEIQSGLYNETGKLPTEFELVTRFDVSRQTIRQAITNLKHDGVVYQVQGSGTYVSKPDNKAGRKNRNMTPTILVICTYISDYIFPSIIRGVEAVLSDQGYHMTLAATGNKVDIERKILSKVISDNSVEGIIVEGTKTGLPSPNIGLYKKIEELGIPVVFLHCAYPELNNSVVIGMDDYQGGKLAAKRLISEGCKKLGAFFKSDDRQGLLRYAGFIDGVLEEGLNLESVEIRWYTTEDITDAGYSLDDIQIKNLQDAGIDGYACYNDMVAVALFRDFSKNGYSIPKVISFDHSYLCSAYDRRFESLGHQKEALGRLAAQKISNMINGKTEEPVFMNWLS